MPPFLSLFICFFPSVSLLSPYWSLSVSPPLSLLFYLSSYVFSDVCSSLSRSLHLSSYVFPIRLSSISLLFSPLFPLLLSAPLMFSLCLSPFSLSSFSPVSFHLSFFLCLSLLSLHSAPVTLLLTSPPVSPHSLLLHVHFYLIGNSNYHSNPKIAIIAYREKFALIAKQRLSLQQKSCVYREYRFQI